MKEKCSQKFSASRTIPGQSLYPADLMKRHLAGTLPPIDLSGKYEYHYDENGEQIAEPLPLEMYELHALAVALREKQYEAAIEHRKQKALRERDAIIAEYEKTRTQPVPKITDQELLQNPEPPKKPRKSPSNTP